MKVVLLGPYPVDEQYIRGGVEKVTHNTVQGFLDRDDVDLHVVSPSYHVVQDHQRMLGRVAIHHLTRQRRLCLPTFDALTVMKTRKVIRRIAPDLIHCQESGLEAFIASGIRIPTVVTVHAIFKNEAKFYPGLKARLRYRQIGLLARLAEPRVSRYIASSMYAYAELQKLAQKVHGVIENPIESKYFEVPDARVSGRILFSGTMYPRKGVHDLVAAAARLRERGVQFSLHITGQVNSVEYYDRVRSDTVRYDITDRVSFMGLLSENDLLREFAEAEVVVLPSYAETSPMFIQQAMAAGKAIIATRVGGLPYLIEDGVSGCLIEPGDVSGLAERLSRLLNDDVSRRSWGDRAKSEALARFSVAEVAEKTVTAYRDVLDAKGTRR